MRLLFLTQKKSVLKAHVMVNKYKKVGWLGATTIHQMKSSRLYTQYMPLEENQKKNIIVLSFDKKLKRSCRVWGIIGSLFE